MLIVHPASSARSPVEVDYQCEHRSSLISQIIVRDLLAHTSLAPRFNLILNQACKRHVQVQDDWPSESLARTRAIHEQDVLSLSAAPDSLAA